MSLSAEEFAVLQRQLIGLKEENYVLKDRESKTMPELQQLRELTARLQKDVAKYRGIVGNNKAKELAAVLMEENDTLRAAVEMKTEALREMQEKVTSQSGQTTSGSDQLSGADRRLIQSLQDRVAELEAENKKLMSDMKQAELDRQNTARTGPDLGGVQPIANACAEALHTLMKHTEDQLDFTALYSELKPWSSGKAQQSTSADNAGEAASTTASTDGGDNDPSSTSTSSRPRTSSSGGQASVDPGLCGSEPLLHSTDLGDLGGDLGDLGDLGGDLGGDLTDIPAAPTRPLVADYDAGDITDTVPSGPLQEDLDVRTSDAGADANATDESKQGGNAGGTGPKLETVVHKHVFRILEHYTSRVYARAEFTFTGALNDLKTGAGGRARGASIGGELGEADAVEISILKQRHKDALDRAAADFDEERGVYAKKLEDVVDELDSTKNDLREVTRTLAARDMAIQKLEQDKTTERTVHQKVVKDLQLQLETLQQHAEVQASDMQDSLQTVKTSRDEYQSEIKQVHAALKEKETECESLQRNMKKVCEELAQDKMKLGNLQKVADEAETIRAENQILRDDKEGLSKNLEALRVQHDELKEESAEIEAAYRESKEAKNSGAARIEELETELADAKKVAEDQAAEYEETMTKTLDEHSDVVEAKDRELIQTRDELQQVNESLSQVREELEEMTTKHDEAASLAESRANDITERDSKIEGLESDLEAKSDELTTAVEEHKAAIEKAEEDVNTATTRITELEQEVEDVQMEKRVAAKKNQQLLRELKTQLSKEIKSREEVQNNLVEEQRRWKEGHLPPAHSVPSPHGSGPGQHPPQPSPYGSDSGAMNNSSSGRRLSVSSTSASEAGSHAGSGVVRAAAPPSPDPALIEESQRLAARVGQLLETNLKLEQRLRDTNETCAQLRQDSHQKAQIINDLIQRQDRGGLAGALGDQTLDSHRNRQQRRPTEPSGRQSGGGGGLKSFFSSPKSNDYLQAYNIAAEANARMSAAMEQTMLENIKLKDDVKTIGKEVQRLLGLNKDLQAQIGEWSGGPVAAPVDSPAATLYEEQYAASDDGGRSRALSQPASIHFSPARDGSRRSTADAGSHAAPSEGTRSRTTTNPFD